MTETMETLEDGAIRVCVEDFGVGPVCCIVSSMHLVYDKLPHLRRKVEQRAKAAFLEASY